MGMGMGIEKLEGAKKILFVALILDMIVTALVIASNLWSVGMLKDIALQIITVDQSTISALEFWSSFAKIMFLTLIGVGLALVKWLNACYRYAKEDIGATGFKNEAWTALGWIIPVFNLFKPYQIVSEIYKAGAPDYVNADDWKKESSSWLLLTWWIFWTVTHLIGWIASKELIRNSLRDDLTIQQSINFTELQTMVCVISLIIAGLWFVIAKEITQRLIARCSLDAERTNVIPADSSSQKTSPLRLHAFDSKPFAQVIPVGTHQVVEAPTSSTHTSITLGPFDEDSIYAIIAEELESKMTDKGLWTRLYAECNGDEKQIKVLYIKRRAERLLEVQKLKRDDLAHQALERQKQENLIPEESEKWLQRHLGLADQNLISSVLNGDLSNTSHLLESGVSPFGTDKNGVSMPDLAKKSGNDEMFYLLKIHEAKTMGAKVDALICKFRSGTDLTSDDVLNLVDVAGSLDGLVNIQDAVDGLTLLHWCALHDMHEPAATLLSIGADPRIKSSRNKTADQLSRSASLAKSLKAAASIP